MTGNSFSKRRSPAKGLLLLFLAMAAFLFLTTANSSAESVINISSFDDLKPYIVEDTVPHNQSVNPRNVLRLKEGRYKLTKDIDIDENAAYFNDKRERVGGGILDLGGN